MRGVFQSPENFDSFSWKRYSSSVRTAGVSVHMMARVSVIMLAHIGLAWPGPGELTIYQAQWCQMVQRHTGLTHLFKFLTFGHSGAPD